jgi:hypothetical protein
MKTAVKILIHTWFPLSIAVCILGGDPWAAMMCTMGYGSIIGVVHGCKQTSKPREQGAQPNDR